jgi:hypothetical protein
VYEATGSTVTEDLPEQMGAAMTSMARCGGETTAIAVGAGSGLIGIALLVAPCSAGRPIGIVDRRHARLIGAIDLVIAAGLLTARPRWPWLTARAAANISTAALAITAARDTDRRRRAVIFGAALCAATIGDVAGVRALRRRNGA